MTPSLFIISTGRFPGARLSAPGHWGNLPMADAVAAEAEARRIGGPAAMIRREVCR